MRDPWRSAPGNEEKSPGRYVMLPGRCWVDPRFAQYPATLRVLCAYAAYTSARRDGRCWPSQMLLAKKLGISQSAVANQVKRLKEWGYLERLTHAVKGHGTAMWRVVYDPTRDMTEIDANLPAKDRHEDIERAAAAATLDALETGSERRTVAKGRVVDRAPAEKGQSVTDGTATAAESEYKPQVIHNRQGCSKSRAVASTANTTSTNSNLSSSVSPTGDNEYQPQVISSPSDNHSEVIQIDRSKGGVDDKEARALCETYSRLRHEVFGIPWQHDLRQIQVARQLLDLDVSLDAFAVKAKETMKWHASQGKAPPNSLRWFIKHFEAKSPAIDPVRKLARSWRA
jgi:DNA-binding Lrp family transcriptional regulator